MKKMITLLCAGFCLLSGCAARTAPAVQEQESLTVSQSEKKPASQASSPAPSELELPLLPIEQSQDTPPSNEPMTLPDWSEERPIPEDVTQLPSDSILLLVNAQNGLSKTYEPELKEVQGGYKMDVRAADQLTKMIADAKAQGISLLVCSAYRPYSSQERNFNQSVNQYVNAGLSYDEAVSKTSQWIAQPGKSEHQTGLAVDIVTPSYQGLDAGFADTAAAKWMAKNAPDYGFILRYPKDKTDITGISFEPWHFRYVGVADAKAITEAGICLEEYVTQN